MITLITIYQLGIVLQHLYFLGQRALLNLFSQYQISPFLRATWTNTQEIAYSCRHQIINHVNSNPDFYKFLMYLYLGLLGTYLLHSSCYFVFKSVILLLKTVKFTVWTLPLSMIKNLLHSLYQALFFSKLDPTNPSMNDSQILKQNLGTSLPQKYFVTLRLFNESQQVSIHRLSIFQRSISLTEFLKLYDRFQKCKIARGTTFLSADAEIVSGDILNIVELPLHKKVL
jgi:hypothetical protein